MDSPALIANCDGLGVFGDCGFLDNICVLFAAADTFCCDDEFTVNVCREFLLGRRSSWADLISTGYSLGGVFHVVVGIITIVGDIDVNPSKSLFGLCFGCCYFRNRYGLE